MALTWEITWEIKKNDLVFSLHVTELLMPDLKYIKCLASHFQFVTAQFVLFFSSLYSFCLQSPFETISKLSPIWCDMCIQNFVSYIAFHGSGTSVPTRTYLVSRRHAISWSECVCQ